jgi:hypothetical protein
MKVLDTNLTGTPATAAPPAGSVTRQAGLTGAQPGKPGSGDSVEFSGVAGKVSATLSAQSADRANRVAALARDYQAGRYQPAAGATSRALVSETLAADSSESGSAGNTAGNKEA